MTPGHEEVAMRYLRVAIPILLALSASCSHESPLSCSADLEPPLVITVRDSISGALLPNVGITSTGPAGETVIVGSDVGVYPINVVRGAGTYSVSVSAAGYVTWTGTEVVVARDLACAQFYTVAILVRLAPA